ncbi:hypothetical protein HK405_002944 [Cladochytrium tenue]|nr:hypothetical protein HK405_002944 [Cladochytrium tenue]
MPDHAGSTSNDTLHAAAVAAGVLVRVAPAAAAWALCAWRAATAAASSLARAALLALSLAALAAVGVPLASTWIAHSTATGDHSAPRDWLVRLAGPGSSGRSAAYAEAARDPHAWFWLSQLLFLHLTAVVLVWAEGAHRYGTVDGSAAVGQADAKNGKRLRLLGSGRGRTMWFVNAYVYALLGFQAAISIALPLFLAQRLVLTGPYTIARASRPSFLLTLFVVLAALGILALPLLPVPLATYARTGIHLLLFVPVLAESGLRATRSPPPMARPRAAEPGVGVAPLYTFVAGAALAAHAQLALQHFVQRGEGLVALFAAAATGGSEATGAVVLADLTLAGAAAAVYMFREALVGPNAGRAVAVFAVVCLVAVSPLVSVSVTFPVFLAYREAWRISSFRLKLKAA